MYLQFGRVMPEVADGWWWSREREGEGEGSCGRRESEGGKNKGNPFLKPKYFKNYNFTTMFFDL